jgi:uncharacterized protein (TIGR02145 family)
MYQRSDTMSMNFAFLRYEVLAFIAVIPLTSLSQEGTPSYKSITDIEGNVYKTVLVGKQEWMADNLRTATFRDGTPIVLMEQDRDWLNTKNAAWCYYDDLPEYNPLYGKLYNAYAVVDSRGLCPSGWRIPAKKDWDELQLFLGRSWVASKMKSTNRAHWQPNPLGNSWTMGNPAPVREYRYIGPPATNSTGLTILAGGFREPLGQYIRMCQEGIYWSYPPPSSVAPIYYPAVNLAYNFGGIMDREIAPNTGASVRCIRE